MRVVLFRPRQRERKGWVERLRQSGHNIRFVHDLKRIGETDLVVLDSQVERWKEYARWLQEQSAPVILLVEDKAIWANELLNGMGIADIITPDEEPKAFISALDQLDILKQDTGSDLLEDYLRLSDNEIRFDSFPSNLRSVPSDSASLEPELATNVEEPSVAVSAIPLSLRKAWRKNDRETAADPTSAEHTGDLETEAVESHHTPEEPPIEPIPEILVAPVLPSTKRTRPSVAAVYAAKGGVGKTTFLLHLATLLAKAGCRVCVIDLDLMHGTVASTLQLYPGKSIIDLIDCLDRPKAAKACLIATEMGFSIVAAPREAGVSIRSPESLPKLFHWLASTVDIVLVDTSAQLEGLTKLALEQADHLWLMTTDEKASIHGLVRMAPLLSRLHVMPDISIIWNRLAEPVSDEVRGLFPWPVTLQLPESPAVTQAIRAASILDVSLRDPYLSRIKRLVDGWTDSEKATAGPRRSLLLRRLFLNKQ